MAENFPNLDRPKPPNQQTHLEYLPEIKDKIITYGQLPKKTPERKKKKDKTLPISEQNKNFSSETMHGRREQTETLKC